MNNLKRVLSTVLAGTMLAGMMVVGASAASFPDADKIEHTEAVNTLAALNVLNGKEDGNFDPQGSLTRAEMAKLAVFILHGGKDPVLGTKAVPTYSDIKDNWAESYIEYCSATGIIAGMGDGTFGPNTTLTGAQAAKMLMVAMGYNAEVFGFSGNIDWDTNVNVEANKIGLYDGLETMDPSATITRDQAAQLVYNAIFAGIMEKTYTHNIATGAVSNGYTFSSKDARGNAYNLFTEKFNGKVGYGIMTDVSYDSTKGEYTYTLTDNAFSAFMPSFKSDVDYTENMGMKTKVMYKTTTSGDVVYGAYAEDAELVVSAKGADITIGANKVTISGKSYNTAATVNVYSAGGNIGDLSGKNEAFMYDLYDTNDDGKIDLAVTAPFTFGKVTFAGTKSVTIQAQGGASTAYDLSSIDCYEGIAKDDYVLVTLAADTANNKVVVEKVETQTGSAAAVKSTTDVQIDGTWYKYTTGSDTFFSVASVGDNIDYAAVNGYIYATSKVNGTSVDNILYVAETKYNATDDMKGADTLGHANANVISANLGTYEGVDTRVMLPDGTTSVVKAMRVDVKRDAATDVAVKFVPAKGLYTYKVNSNGVYELSAVRETAGTVPTANNNAYYSVGVNKPEGTIFATASTTYYVKGSGNNVSKLHNKLIDDDAVIYLANSSGGETKTKTVSGAELKTMGTFGTASEYITKKVNGVDVVIMAYITGSDGLPVSTTDTGYGYITSSGYYTEKNGSGVVVFKAWNGTAEVELTDVTSGLSASSVSSYTAGTFIKYTNTATEGEIKIDGTFAPTEFAVTGYDGSYNIYLKTASGATYSELMKADNKTVVIYIDSAKGEGVEGGSISLAQEVGVGQYISNVVAYSDGSWANNEELSVLFVDVANKLDGATYTIAAPTAKTVNANGVTKVENNSTVTSAKAGDTVALKFKTTGNVAEGKGVTVTATFKKADNTTFTASKSLAGGTAAGAQEVNFTMPGMNITEITFAVTANT